MINRRHHRPDGHEQTGRRGPTWDVEVEARMQIEASHGASACG